MLVRDLLSEESLEVSQVGEDLFCVAGTTPAKGTILADVLSKRSVAVTPTERDTAHEKRGKPRSLFDTIRGIQDAVTTDKALQEGRKNGKKGTKSQNKGGTIRQGNLTKTFEKEA